MHNLHGTEKDKEGEESSDEESDEDEEEDGDKKPQMELAMMPHYGGINRVRVCSDIFCGELVHEFLLHRELVQLAQGLILLLNSQATQRGEQSLAAVWSDKGQVEIFDLQPQLVAVHSSAAMASFIKQQKEATALFSFSGHMAEGFAVDWSPTVPGKRLLDP